MKLPSNPLIYEILEAAGKAKTKEERISILRKHESWALKDVLRASYDSTVIFTIPDGAPPYEPNLPESTPSNLLRKNTDFRYIVKGGTGDTLPAFKREKIYIGLLESIHPKDAEVVINMVNRKKPAKGITEKVVKEAFPNLIK
tara:strand:+ start:34 stop:462 length:429 start_codon:yes stop_codon:yes gene_type:complete